MFGLMEALMRESLFASKEVKDYLIYQESPDISEDGTFHGIISPSKSLRIFSCYQHHRHFCPGNNTAGTHSAPQCTRKDQNISVFVATDASKREIATPIGWRRKMNKVVLLAVLTGLGGNTWA
jgi:hypothetical protein